MDANRRSEMSEKKVYVVLHQQHKHEGTDVVGVFSTWETADAHAKTFDGWVTYVEEWTLDGDMQGRRVGELGKVWG